ncbi:MAG: ABC transporter ATP-binding protein/permease [Clostridia bacterium]|nr:ABC transporter ATP-binding protein/permease [Clostridia bacterium]
MLKIRNISKTYKTGDLVQRALDGVSLNLRDNEFVAVLGPSGSGKTTLLNVIGGLDRYDTGDLIINGISTKKYKDRDWDSYRNHTIGFVFQSYNLIPHQSVLSNVELALTISGISKKERRRRATQALVDVGLGDQLHKKPNQLSGGQMQRVAIARALVNDPEILLADEPTGALDTETSVQVMELLKQVAKDHLVVMVTHNPELAEKYATRTVMLRDGKITGDTMPYEVDDKEEAQHKNMGKSSMSFFTSLSLSFNNLLTKKARTILTAFAGSIGIIGIALIMSLSNGVNVYITDIQKSTMTSYPITIDAQTIDLSSVIKSDSSINESDGDHDRDAVYSNGRMLQAASAFTSSVTTNNLSDFKKYLDDPDSEIHKYIGDSGIVYIYDLSFGIYTYDSDGALINTNTSSVEMTGFYSQFSSSGMIPGIYEQILPSPDGLVSSAVKKSYETVSGRWPEAYDEVVLVLNENNEISYTDLYHLGLIPASEYNDITGKITKGESVNVPQHKFSYEQILEKEYYLATESDKYVKNGDTFKRISSDTEAFKDILDNNSTKIKIVGIVRPVSGTTGITLTMNVGYTRALTDYIIKRTEESEIVTAQNENKNVNVLNGLSFEPADDEQKKEDAIKYVKSLGISEKARLCSELLIMQKIDIMSIPGLDLSQYAGMTMSSLGEAELSGLLDLYMQNPADDTLITIYDKYVSAGSYSDNMTNFGVISKDAPASVNIYADTFEAKDKIAECIDAYNKNATEENKITYTDYVGLLMSSITTIINVVSYVLIAFVAVSLVVSSIMIGIITYISVLERTKEIGILRAIGASKRNISNVFNAETFIIGLFAGLLGVGISALLLIPGNAVIHHFVGANDVNAIMPIPGAIILVILSVVLTFIGGLIPAKKASRKDPVLALRTE